MCIHCGTPVPSTAADSRFCCTGCAYVHALLQEEGLEKFYELRGEQTLVPVSTQALRDQDFEWLAQATREAEEKALADATVARLHLGVQGMSCLGCVWLMERVHQQQPGAGRITIHASRGDLEVEWNVGAFAPIEFAKRLQHFGYLLGPSTGIGKGKPAADDLVRRMGLCGAFAMNAMAFTLPTYLGMSRSFVFAEWFDLVAACSATLALLLGGSYFAGKSWRALQHGVLHIDTPIALGIGAAWLGAMIGWATGVDGLKYFDFVATFIFLMLVGRWLQQFAVERNSRRMLQGAVVADTVMVCHADGSTEAKAIRDIAVGDSIRLKPGELCPVRAQLSSPHVGISLEWINGESAATERTSGQLVPSGALVVSNRPVEVEVLESWEGSLLQRLVASDRPEHVFSPFVGALLKWYLAVVVLIGIAGGAAWLLMGSSVVTALQVMISVFVVSCPCALGVAAPFADDLANGLLQRLGVFVRTGFLWQRLVRVRSVLFDKTGTLTAENPTLENPEALDTLDPASRQALSQLVHASLHPISRSIFDALGSFNIASQQDASPAVEEVVGMGLLLQAEHGATYALGRPGWKDDGNYSGNSEDVVFSRDGKRLAAFAFEDRLRPSTRAAMDRLRQSGLTVQLLSGDRHEKVARIAAQLGLEESAWHAEMTPDQKAASVRQAGASQTLFIGDGANDSLAFDEALCAGSPVTGKNFLERKADFYFLGNSLRFLPDLLSVAHRRMLAVRCVFTFALVYNASAIALALAGVMSPLLAAVLMPASSVVTLGIAQLMLGQWGRKMKGQDRKTDPQTVRGANGEVALS
ncbi:Cu2+-exporting ATPase [Roseimicrobium gellanilyticum]|uniref:Cu2+-exporting ATPase n=2 Tax=Roseimicrobium gellanilyticum TaxID=748857 RepID=A0A366HTP9_9BACT|nr:Cu2+-exporting ATPase [Roseimicrobium gellanilyticum]